MSDDSTNSFNRPVAWSPTGPIDLGTVGGLQGIALGVNSAGQIVGSTTPTTAVAPTHATYWSGIGGLPADLGTLPGLPNSDAININAGGQIVGYSYIGSGDSVRATFWASSSASPIDLGTLGGAIGYAYSLNDSGQIVGHSSTSGGELHATLWNSSTSAPIDLGTLGGTRSLGRDINDAGVVVGSSQLADGAIRAFLWDGSIHPLDTLGGGSDQAWSLNDAGQVVGQSSSPEGDLRAVLWTHSGITDLNTSMDSSGIGWIIRDARGINDAGQIVGSGVANGQSHAVLLTYCATCTAVVTLPPTPPIPEPETYCLMLAGLAGLWARARRSAGRVLRA
jgi:probable HAF family extracellular repeat protein